MIRALITGSEGFVGKYLRTELEMNGRLVMGMDRIQAPDCVQCDLNDAAALSRVIRESRPQEVYHLAGQADVGKSWKLPLRRTGRRLFRYAARDRDGQPRC